MKILITAANSDIAIAMAKIAKEAFPSATILGLAPDGKYPGTLFFDEIHNVPWAADPNFFNSLKTEIEKHKPDIFIPVSDAEINFLTDKVELLKTKTIINPKFILDNFGNKYQMVQWFIKNQLPHPKTFLLKDISNIDFPVILKPIMGAGSRGLFKPKTQQEFTALKQYLEIRNEVNNYLVQESISSDAEEYTCVAMRVGSDYRDFILKRRLNVGITVEAQHVIDKNISNLLKNINEKIPNDYFINVQLRLERNVPYVFEINTRFSSTIMMRHLMGFKDFEWMVRAALSEKLPTYNFQKNLKAIRLYQEYLIRE